jgi:hypothetical protein
MTIEQLFTVAGFVLAASVAVLVAIVIGHQIARFIRAIGRIAEVVATIVGRLLRLALIGGLAIGLIAGAIWWAIQPTAEAAPATPLPTQEVETPTTTSRAELPVMSPIQAQAYGEGFMFISSYDHTVCTLHKVDYQEELVGYCE